MDLVETHNEIMKQHEDRLNKIQRIISRGDWTLVAEKTGLKKNTAQVSFSRITSKNHLRVVKALEEVISERLSQFKII